MKFITSRASLDSPLFLVLSLVLSIIQFPCGVILLLKGTRAYNLAVRVTSFWLSCHIYILVLSCLANGNNEFEMFRDWRLYSMTLSMGFGGLLLGYFIPKLGIIFIGLSSGWAVAEIFVIFVEIPLVELIVSSVISIVALFILCVRPQWLRFYLAWTGTQIFIGSTKLLVMGFLVYDSEFREVDDNELFALQIGCIIAMLIVFVCSLIDSDDPSPTNEKNSVLKC